MVSFLSTRQWTIAVIVGFLMLLLALGAVLLVLPALTTAQCEPQLTVQRLSTQDAGGTEQTTFAPGETIRFVAEVNNDYGGWMLGSNGTELAITTSFYSAANPVDIPPGISTWTWEAAAPSTAGDYTVEIRVYDHFCGISGGLGRNFIVGEPEETPPPDEGGETDLVANAGPDQTVPGPSPVNVQFDGSGSTGDIVRYQWYNQWGLLLAEGATPVIEVNFGHEDPQPGTQRTFTLVVEDSQGNTAEDEVNITLGETTEEEPSCPEPTVTISPSTVNVGGSITMQGKDWLPDGRVTITAINGSTQYNIGSVSVSDSGEWELNFDIDGDITPPGDYDNTFSEDHDGCELRVIERLTIIASSDDTEPPTVSWVKPVGNREYYPSASGTVELEVDATDNVGIHSVAFERWDAVNLRVIGITTDSSPPYQASVEVNALNMKWNEIVAVVEDKAGNKAGEPIMIYRLKPAITLDPTEGFQSKVVAVRGSGWFPGDKVIINLGEPASKVGQATVDGDGNFTAKFTVPAGAAIGEQKVIAITANDKWGAEAVFQVTESTEKPSCPEPTITLSASSGKVGDTITVQGKDWIPGGAAALVITPDTSSNPGLTQINMGSVPVPDSGEWQSSFAVPDTPPGVYYLIFSEIHDGCMGHVQNLFTVARVNFSTLKQLPQERAWREPNDAAHINHCGPGATQVALDARLPASQVPDIDTLGSEEKLDPNPPKSGTYMSDIVPVLNKRLNTTWYKLGHARDQDELEAGILRNLDNGYAMLTGLRTSGMPGWGSHDAYHIVAVIGFYKTDDDTKYVGYIETAAPKAKYTGTHMQIVPLSDFWSYVKRNNVQAW